MNPMQRLVLIASAAAFLLVSAFPPWMQESKYAESGDRDSIHRTWRFVGSPPRSRSSMGAGHLDWAILGYEWGALAVTSLILLAAFKSRRKADAKAEAKAEEPVP